MHLIRCVCCGTSNLKTGYRNCIRLSKTDIDTTSSSLDFNPLRSWWNIGGPLVLATWYPILSSALCFLPRELPPLQPCHSCASPSVLESATLAFSLWVPLYGPLGYVSVWSPQRVASPTPRSLCYLLLYRSLLCLSPKLLVAYSSRPPDPQDVPQALTDKHLQLLLQILGQPSSSRTIQEHRLHILPKDSQLVSAVDRHIGLNIANACLAFPMRAWMSSSVPPFLVTMLPRYVNLSTSSTCSPSIDNPSSRLVQIRISFVFVVSIFRPTFAPCSFKALCLIFHVLYSVLQ